MKIAFLTHGCKANSADTRMLEEAAALAGHELSAVEEAEVLVLNTCTVTHRADADGRASLRRLRRANPGALLVATGCMAQVAAAGLEGADLRLPNTEKTRLLEHVAALQSGLALPAPRTWDEAGVAFRPPDAIAGLPLGRTRPFLKIQDGCDRACTYCIIPRARGPLRSLPPEEVAASLARYGALGAGEVVLTGIHVGRYGQEPGGPGSLAELLERLCREEGPRLRLASLEPDELDDRLLALMRHPRLCPHLHLPLQSGDDEVLARMGRRYRTPDYARTVARLRRVLPEAGLGADLIVGFPGEDEASFARTLAFVEALDLSYLHVFSYSARPGTPAASMAGAPPAAVVRRRVAEVRALGERKHAAFRRRQVGRRELVLVEGRTPAGTAGLSGNYLAVRLAGEAHRAGALVPVRFVTGDEVELAEETP